MRRRRPEKREILPDPIYSNLLVAKFVNYIMVDGKKGIAEKIFYTLNLTLKILLVIDKRSNFREIKSNFTK